MCAHITVTTTENVLLNPATGKTEALACRTARVLDCGRDGQMFLTPHRDGKKLQLGLTAKGDKEVRALTELKGWWTGSPVGREPTDGKAVLYTDADPGYKGRDQGGA